MFFCRPPSSFWALCMFFNAKWKMDPEGKQSVTPQWRSLALFSLTCGTHWVAARKPKVFFMWVCVKMYLCMIFIPFSITDWSFHQQNVPACCRILADRPTAGDLLPTAANGLSNRSSYSHGHHLLAHVDVVSFRRFGVEEIFRAGDGSASSREALRLGLRMTIRITRWKKKWVKIQKKKIEKIKKSKKNIFWKDFLSNQFRWNTIERKTFAARPIMIRKFNLFTFPDIRKRKFRF